MKECKLQGVDYLVAPYEADAQLSFLSRAGHVHAVVTDDTDLVLFGCQKVLLHALYTLSLPLRCTLALWHYGTVVLLEI